MTTNPVLSDLTYPVSWLMSDGSKFYRAEVVKINEWLILLHSSCVLLNTERKFPEYWSCLSNMSNTQRGIVLSSSTITPVLFLSSVFSICKATYGSEKMSLWFHSRVKELKMVMVELLQFCHLHSQLFVCEKFHRRANCYVSRPMSKVVAWITRIAIISLLHQIWFLSIRIDSSTWSKFSSAFFRKNRFLPWKTTNNNNKRNV